MIDVEELRELVAEALKSTSAERLAADIGGLTAKSVLNFAQRAVTNPRHDQRLALEAWAKRRAANARPSSRRPLTVISAEELVDGPEATEVRRRLQKAKAELTAARARVVLLEQQVDELGMELVYVLADVHSQLEVDPRAAEVLSDVQLSQPAATETTTRRGIPARAEATVKRRGASAAVDVPVASTPPHRTAPASPDRKTPAKSDRGSATGGRSSG